MKEGTLTEYKNIVLVDDDADDRILFIEAMDFVHPLANIFTKKDGEELMEHLSASSLEPDVIFLDLNMPRINGKECLKELRANKKYQTTPIIIFTTSLNPVDVQETFNEGATFFMRKPNSFEELKETLHNLLHSRIKTANERSREKFVINHMLTIV
jgi:DNA-binding response OmpR family regulator